MHTSYGDMEIDIPRDRNGEFEPQIVKKYQNTVTQDMEEKNISMYAKGMTTGDIESHMRELYDLDISDSTISRITDKILPIVKEWQERPPLRKCICCCFMDAIHYHVLNEGRIVKRAVYIAIGIDMEGHKDVLGMYVGQNESALAELDRFDEKWSGKYPKIGKSRKDNRANFSTYFKYPEAVRRLVYTTNTIEGFNRQLRKVTKSKTVFPSDGSLLKMLYLAMMNITKKWTGHRQDWGQIHSQLEIFFEEGLSGL